MLYPLPNLALCSHASCFHLSCFSPLLVSSPKQSVFIFERVISEKTKFSNSYSFPASKKNIFLLYCSKFSDKKGCYSKQFNNICGELPNWNKFFIWIAKYYRTASSLPFKFMISSGILPSSSLTLPCLSVRKI